MDQTLGMVPSSKEVPREELEGRTGNLEERTCVKVKEHVFIGNQL